MPKPLTDDERDALAHAITLAMGSITTRREDARSLLTHPGMQEDDMQRHLKGEIEFCDQRLRQLFDAADKLDLP